MSDEAWPSFSQRCEGGVVGWSRQRTRSLDLGCVGEGRRARRAVQRTFRRPTSTRPEVLCLCCLAVPRAQVLRGFAGICVSSFAHGLWRREDSGVEVVDLGRAVMSHERGESRFLPFSSKGSQVQSPLASTSSPAPVAGGDSSRGQRLEATKTRSEAANPRRVRDEDLGFVATVAKRLTGDGFRFGSHGAD